MRVYLVGGAVRDRLLGLEVSERDWVVVGSTQEEMLALGYRQVGRDFPVFIHPVTGEEYALARTERKSTVGHTGFICHFSPEVTLEEDLRRRDLTINAMAQTDDGEIIDYYGGQRDLQQRWLRHVSPAFREDPLRVLRVARFSAIYVPMGFRIAQETAALMRSMVSSRELEYLTAERIWRETQKALSSQAPQCYFTTLRECGALMALFPEINELFGVPVSAKWHPEVDTGLHTIMALEQAAKLTNDQAVRFAVLCHDFGKGGVTPKRIWPHHPEHSTAGGPIISAFCRRLRVPNALRDLALLMAELHPRIHRAHLLTPELVLELFNRLDLWRRPQRLQQIILACKADLMGHQGFENMAYPQAELLLNAFNKAVAVTVKDIASAGFDGPAIQQILQQRRLKALSQPLIYA